MDVLYLMCCCVLHASRTSGPRRVSGFTGASGHCGGDRGLKVRGPSLYPPKPYQRVLAVSDASVLANYNSTADCQHHRP